MKAKYLFIGLALASLLCACNRDEESLFENSAAERAQQSLDNANDILTAPANGWEMLYFANTYSCGYNVLVKFDTNGRVTATAKNSLTTGNKIVTDSTSTWEVKLDYGPILTFDTYNEVLHAWADPQTDGDGYLGDYEFLILHADANYVKLKGKKHSAYCFLFPYEEGLLPADYFAQVEALKDTLFGNANLLHLNAGASEYLLHSGSSGIFSLTNPGELPDAEAPDEYPFALRQRGLQLMFPFLTLEDTQFDVLEGQLVSKNCSMQALPASSYVFEYMGLLGGSWTIDITETCEQIKSDIATIDAKLKATYTKNKKNAGVSGLRIKQTSSNFQLVFSYYGSSSKAAVDMYFVYELVEEDGALKIAYVEPANENAQKTLNAFPEIANLLNSLSGTFAPEALVAINPSVGIKLSNKSNSEVWYTISGKL